MAEVRGGSFRASILLVLALVAPRARALATPRALAKVRQHFAEKFSRPPAPGKLILVRHGESTWNFNKTFTGWVDADLSERGELEVEHAARLLLERGYTVDVVYTSLLKRAIRSAWILLKEWNQSFRPVLKDWRLNERHYGALQGLSKPGLSEALGSDIVNKWRAGYATRPPELPPTHAMSPLRERKYAGVPPDSLPLGESLQDCLERVGPLWRERVRPDLLAGQDVLVVAHANSLRGMLKEIDGISDTAIEGVGIPNGIPLVYEFERVERTADSALTLRPIASPNCCLPLSGEFLEERGLLRKALQREREAQKAAAMPEPPSRGPWGLRGGPAVVTPLEKSLTALVAERKFFRVDDAAELLDPPQAADNSVQFPGGDFYGAPVDDDLDQPKQERRRVRRSVRPWREGEPAPPPLLVIIRHGKTEHNKLGLFTGWEDAPLAPEGRAEAAAAGDLLAKHGIELDVVYTSWLSRAIETAWICLIPLDALWLPIVKTWRLNERMYGALTGLSKRMIKQRHGEGQFNRWRRGYETRPPPCSPFSPVFPGNDERYVKYVDDMPRSFRQCVIRSLGHGRLELHHRRMPRTESLRDCMERTIPFFKDRILPESIERNKTVLVASSENAIRGLLMHLCDVPPEDVPEIEIPTGIPIIYDFEGRCIHLLDDGLLPPPRDRYNFGKAADLLFRPCTYDDVEEACYVGDPHLYLDDRFYESIDDDVNAQHEIARREATRRVAACGVDMEFTTEDTDAEWRGQNGDQEDAKTNAESTTDWQDEPAYAEI